MPCLTRPMCPPWVNVRICCLYMVKRGRGNVQTTAEGEVFSCYMRFRHVILELYSTVRIISTAIWGSPTAHTHDMTIPPLRPLSRLLSGNVAISSGPRKRCPVLVVYCNRNVSSSTARRVSKPSACDASPRCVYPVLFAPNCRLRTAGNMSELTLVLLPSPSISRSTFLRRLHDLSAIV